MERVLKVAASALRVGGICSIVVLFTLSGCGDAEPLAVSATGGSTGPSEDAIPIRIGTVGSDVMDEVQTFQPLIEYLNQQPELAAYQFKAVAAPDYDSMVRMLVDKNVEIFVDSPFPIVQLRDRANLKLLLRRSKKGVKEYHSVLFVKKDSGIDSVEGLLGKAIAFEDPSSTSSYALPAASLKQDGMTLVSLPRADSSVPDGAIGYVFSEDDDNTFLWVIKGKVTAGATNNVDFDGLPLAQRDQLSIIYETKKVARHIVSARSDLEETFIEPFTAALIQMSESESGIAALMKFEKTGGFDRVPDEEAMIREISELIETLE